MQAKTAARRFNWKPKVIEPSLPYRFYTRTPFRTKWEVEDCEIPNYYITTDIKSVNEFEDRMKDTI